MPKIIHILIAGEQEEDLHLAGIPRLKADEVVIFCRKDERTVPKLSTSLSKMGLQPRIIEAQDQYLDCYRKASEEAAGCFVDDVVVAINMSAGSRLMCSAVEDAFRIQLFDFHMRNRRYSGACAFRYFITKASGTKMRIAPIWNLHSRYHNDMFEMLAETKDTITVTKVRELLYDRGIEVGGYESFRKEFRRFRKWFKNMPCFKEVVKKGPEFKIDVD